MSKNVLCIFLIVVIWNNALIANICYFHMNETNQYCYAEGIEMMSEIRELEEQHEFSKIAVVGYRRDAVMYKHHDPQNGKITRYGEIHLLSTSLEHSFLYDPIRTICFLRETFGLELEVLDLEQRNELLSTDPVRAMGCWPAADSIAVIDDICVIKLSDIGE